VTRGKLPARARAEPSAALAGFQGGDARAKWKAALAAHNAAKRRGRFTRAARRTGPGMIRRMPDGPPDGGEAA
jgi:hypothetical protein